MNPAILIADPSRELRRLQREVVQRLGAVEILEAEDGVSAAYRLQERHFRVDLLLLDWAMPRLDGPGLARRLKSHPALRAIPILMVFNQGDEQRLRDVWRAGVDGCLIKPFTLEMFLEALLALRPAQRRPEAAAFPAPGEQPAEAFLDALSPAARGRLGAQLESREVAGEAAFLAAGGRVEHFWCVLEGAVVERRPAERGGQVVREHGAGDCFAAIELMTGLPLEHEFAAPGGALVGRLAAPDFHALVLSFPEINLTLSRLLAVRTRELAAPGEPAAAPASEALSGSLEVLELPDLIQAINLRQRTGVLELPEIQSEVEIAAGQVVFVRTPLAAAADGETGFLEIVRRRPKKFNFLPRALSGERNVGRNTTLLLFDCLRLVDEGERKDAAGP